MFKKLLILSCISFFFCAWIIGCHESPLDNDLDFEGKEIELEGIVAMVDFEEDFFTLRNSPLIIIVNSFTRFEFDDEDCDFGFHNLQPGQEVEVEGIILDENMVLANEIELEE